MKFNLIISFRTIFILSCVSMLITVTFSTDSQSIRILNQLSEDSFEKTYLADIGDKQYTLTISCKEANMLSISLTPQSQFIEAPTFNIYGNKQPRPKMARGDHTYLHECQADVDIDQNYQLIVKRRKDSQAIFRLARFSFSDFHNQYHVVDESTKWGFGERFQKRFRVTDGKWTIWNRDRAFLIDQGKNGNSMQTYGHHPVYLARQKISKLYHLVYFKNTYGMLIESSKDSDQLIYHSVGGNMHFVIILGGKNPEQVLEKYHGYIGRAHLPPFWSMGYHQCRWGYKNFEQIQQVVQKHKQHDVPLDTMWSDLQYMQNFMIFTINEQTHPPSKLNHLIQTEQMHFVPIVDVGVAKKDYNGMTMGKNLDVFFKNSKNMAQYYTAKVWPGQVHFVDFLHPNATSFWKQQLQRLYSKLKFGGIWLDMDQPSNFNGGQKVFEPFLIQQKDNINTLTINVNLPHYNARKTSAKLLQRQVHAYYGHFAAVATHEYLQEKGKRPFIITRSTSVGTGFFAGHWTGDNVSTWDFLRLSISGNFLFQIFGIPMVGPDICGFSGHTTEQLCSRWIQLGAFYPFSRNHNHIESRSQQAYAFGQNMLKTYRLSLKTRYALLKQMYSAFAYKNGQGSFFRPIIFEFFEDQKAYQQEAVQTQILIGDFLLTTPIVYQKQQERQVYFPGSGEQWYQFQINAETGHVIPQKITKFKGATTSTIRNPLPAAPLTFLRAGKTILTNYPENRSVKLNSDFNIFAALKNGKAQVRIMGIEDYNKQQHLKQCLESGCYYDLTIEKKQNMKFEISWTYKGKEDIRGTLKIKSGIIAEEDKILHLSQDIQISSSNGSEIANVKQ